MKRAATTLFGVVVVAVAICLAQGDEIKRIDQQRVDAIRTGKPVDQFYTADYVGVTAAGVVEDRKTSAARRGTTPTPNFKLDSDVAVRVYGNTAIETGTQRPGNEPVKFLRVWVKDGTGWKLAAHEGTPVSKDTSANAALSSVKDLKPKTIMPKTADERDVLAADEAHVRAEVSNDDAKAGALQTKDYSFVSRAGVLASPTDPPGPVMRSQIVAYDRVQSFVTLAVVQGSLRWTDVKGFSAGVLRFTRVWVKQADTWKLAAEQRTPIAATRPATE